VHNELVGIEFDPAKARANLHNHQASFAHAEQALLDPMAVTIDDPDAEGRATLRHPGHGMHWAGSLFTPRGELTCLISARKASIGESEQYGA
jgi:uncharacterized protein